MTASAALLAVAGLSVAPGCGVAHQALDSNPLVSGSTIEYVLMPSASGSPPAVRHSPPAQGEPAILKDPDDEPKSAGTSKAPAKPVAKAKAKAKTKVHALHKKVELESPAIDALGHSSKRGGAALNPGDVNAEIQTVDGLVVPYPTRKMFRGFGKCTGHKHVHEAIDLGGIGPDWGLGTPIRAMAKSKVTFIGRPADNPGEFGIPDTRPGEVLRGGKMLPRSAVVPGYGLVHFFTENKGRWRSGTVIVTIATEGKLAGHKIRYMHLGAVHPDLRVGSRVAAGQEIGIMGGSGVMHSAPHVHIDIATPKGKRVDVAPLLGMRSTATCAGHKVAMKGKPQEYSAGAARDVKMLRGHSATTYSATTGITYTSSAAVAQKATASTRELAKPKAKPGSASNSRVWSRKARVAKCGKYKRKDNFASGEFYGHDMKVKVKAGQKFKAELRRTKGSYKPRLNIVERGNVVYDGAGRKGVAGSIRAKRIEPGHSSSKARVEIDVLADTELSFRVTAWPKGAHGLLLPRDGAYKLTIKHACK